MKTDTTDAMRFDTTVAPGLVPLTDEEIVAVCGGSYLAPVFPTGVIRLGAALWGYLLN